jgi:hypothetical protein
MSWVATAAVGGGLIAGGASYAINKPKKYELNKIDLKNLTDFPIGQSLSDRILAALNKGENIGMPAGYVEKSTSPFVASREAGFTSKELPFINEQFGARGLSRSTLAARGANEAYAQKERDINELIANAYTQDQAQRKTDTARYENLGYDFNTNQTGLANQEIMANAGIDAQNLGLKQQYDTAKAQNINKAIGTGLAVGKSVYTGDPASALSAFGVGGSGGTSDIQAMLDYLSKKQTPFTTPQSTVNNSVRNSYSAPKPIYA